MVPERFIEFDLIPSFLGILLFCIYRSINLHSKVSLPFNCSLPTLDNLVKTMPVKKGITFYSDSDKVLVEYKGFGKILFDLLKFVLNQWSLSIIIIW